MHYYNLVLVLFCTLSLLTQNGILKGRIMGKKLNKVHRHAWGLKKTTCCACGTATYRLKFIGKWTRTRHPKDYPDKLAYFSRLIGASHSNDFVLWRIGHLASTGIRRMSEYGSLSELDQEIDLNGARIKSKVRTNSIDSCCESVRAKFQVDKYRHFFSAMSRVSPSPDWNVGVDSLDLCDHSKCTWRKKIELNLDPWDAGTDSGMTYNAPNGETVPQELIHYITKKSNLPPESSFHFGGSKVPSLAKIIFHHDKTEGECSKKTPSDNAAAGRVPGSCHVSEWTSWTSCSVTCGTGTRTRGRVILKSTIRRLCPELIDTLECSMGRCRKVRPKRKGKDCKLSKWSQWTKCSVTCGVGIKVKTRNVTQMATGRGKPCRKTRKLRVCTPGPCLVGK